MAENVEDGHGNPALILRHIDIPELVIRFREGLLNLLHCVFTRVWRQLGKPRTQAGGVKFDGIEKGALLEAKGPGYVRFFDDLDPKEWFRHSGAQALVDQARRQSEKVKSIGLPIKWHVAEQQAADAIRKLLMRSRIKGIEVVYTPAL
ncbi:Tox-REase-5 domain-containing protein [Corallococcus llansteffanensis]|uniref:Tox-REase-5 domain-containing protein n=1 Tax=Corallococcus llansteffanensis TaxID=2316731 RepID=UPI001FC96941|nr:Tox-REase-5 domain-containing protein [Corallococcus llansteffanensis]